MILCLIYRQTIQCVKHVCYVRCCINIHNVSYMLRSQLNFTFSKNIASALLEIKLNSANYHDDAFLDPFLAVCC